MSVEWFYVDGASAIGPVSETQLRAVMKSANAGLVVWRDGFDDWKNVSDVPELQPKKPPPIPAAVQAAKAADNAARDKEKEERLTAKNALLKTTLKPVEHAPTLWRLNGIGCTLLGSFHDADVAPMYYSVHAFTFLWIPLLPIKIYLVSGYSPFRFHRWISFQDFRKIYPGKTMALLGSATMQSVLMLGVVIVAIIIIAAIRSSLRGHY